MQVPRIFVGGTSGLFGRPIGIRNSNLYYLSYFSGEVFDSSGPLRPNGPAFLSNETFERFGEDPVSRRTPEGGIIAGDEERIDLALLDIKDAFADFDARLTAGTADVSYDADCSCQGTTQGP